MKLKTVLLFVCALLLGFSANAEIKKDNNEDNILLAANSKKEGKKKSKKGIDEEITNARLRTNSGGKSKFSWSLSLGYYGGNISEPFGKNRPDLYDSTNPDSLSSAAGSISVRYRINKNISTTFGWGFSALTPFHGDPKIKNRDQFEIKNPSFGISSSYKIGRWQNSTGASLGIGLNQKAKETADGFSIGLGHTSLTNITKKLTVGLSTELSIYNYGGEATKCQFRNEAGKDCVVGEKPTEEELLRKGQSVGNLASWSLGVYPFSEYSLGDKYSLRTVFGWFSHTNYYSHDSLWKTSPSPWYQSIGLGISYSRDIYIYPNIQINPKDINADKANVGVSLTMNF